MNLVLFPSALTVLYFVFSANEQMCTNELNWDGDGAKTLGPAL